MCGDTLEFFFRVCYSNAAEGRRGISQKLAPDVIDENKTH